VKINKWLRGAEQQLNQVGIGSANLDVLILVEDELKKDRANLLAHPEIELTAAQIKTLGSKLKRRLKHEPMAYIRGFSEFYGRKFKIDKHVLEPRPESETMIELLLSLKLPAKPRLADIGTGSGAIAITAKLEIPNSQVVATEIDSKALTVAKQNAKLHKTRLEFIKGDLLAPLKQPVNVILANLPYVPDKWQINEAAAMEPRIAIFGGPDGLNLYRRMFKQIEDLNWQPKFVLTEALPPQHKALAKIANASGYKLKTARDFIQVFSV